MSFRYHNSSTHLKRDENYLFSLLKNQALSKGADYRSGLINDENINTINRQLPKGDLQVILSLEEIVTEKNQLVEELRKENALQKKQLENQNKGTSKGNSESSSSLLKEAARLLSVVEMDRSCLEEKLRESSAQAVFEIAEVKKKWEEKEENWQTKEKELLSTIHRLLEEKEEIALAFEASKMDVNEKRLVISLQETETQDLKNSIIRETREKELLLLSSLGKDEELKKVQTELLSECQKTAEMEETHRIEKENSKRIIEEMKDIIASIKEEENIKFHASVDGLNREKEEIVSVKNLIINELEDKLTLKERENQKKTEEIIECFEEEKKRILNQLRIIQQELEQLKVRNLELEEITKQLEILQEKNKELLTAINRLTKENQNLLLAQETSNNTVVTLEEKLASKSLVVNQLELKLTDEKDKNEKKIEEIINESKEEKDRKNKETEELSQQYQELKIQLSTLQQNIVKTNNQYDLSIEEMKSTYEKKAIISLENERKTISQQFHSQLEELSSSLHKKDEEIQQLQQSIVKIKETYQNELNSKDISHSKSLSVVKYDLIFAQERITSLEKELTDLKETHESMSITMSNKNSWLEEKEREKKYELLIQEKIEEMKEMKEKNVKEIDKRKKELTVKFENDLENQKNEFVINFQRKEEEIEKQINLQTETFTKEKEQILKEHDHLLDELKRKEKEEKSQHILQQQIQEISLQKDSFYQTQLNSLEETHTKSLQLITEELTSARDKIVSLENDLLSISQSLSFIEETNRCYENQIYDLKEQQQEKEKEKESEEEEMRKKKNQENDEMIANYQIEFDKLNNDLDNARKEKEQVRHQLTAELEELKAQLIVLEQQLFALKQEKEVTMNVRSLLEEGIKQKEDELTKFKLEALEQSGVVEKETQESLLGKEEELVSCQERILSLENDLLSIKNERDAMIHELKQLFEEEKHQLSINHQTAIEELHNECNKTTSELEKSEEMKNLLSFKEIELKEICMKNEEVMQDLLKQNQNLQQIRNHQNHEKELYYELVVTVKGKFESQLLKKEEEKDKEIKRERERCSLLESRYKKANEKIITLKNELLYFQEETERNTFEVMKEKLQVEEEIHCLKDQMERMLLTNDGKIAEVREIHAKAIQQQEEKQHEIENLKISYLKEINDFKVQIEELEKEKEQYMSSASSTVSFDETFTMTSSCSFSNPYTNNRSRRSKHLSQSLSSSYCSCASHLCSLSLRSELSSSLIKQFLSLYSLIESSFNGESPFVCDFSELQSLSSSSNPSSSSNDENEESIMNTIETQIEYLEFFFEQLFHMINEILDENKQNKLHLPQSSQSLMAGFVSEKEERSLDTLSIASASSNFNDKECESFIKELIETKVKLANVTCDVEKQKQKIFELSSSSSSSFPLSSSSSLLEEESTEEKGLTKKMINYKNLKETGKRKRKKSNSSIQLPTEFLKFIQEKIVHFSNANNENDNISSNEV
jgi:hypothetical protein